MLILGIETSCDECSLALLKDGKLVLANLVASQVDLHRKYGGVVPEIACRKHLEVLNPLLEELLFKAGVDFSQLSAVAVANGPGLVGAVLIGVSAAKVLSGVLGIPLIAVNHLAGHIYANFLEHTGLKFPLLSLVVSGGHTSLIYMPEHCEYQVLGETRDDAAGEAFDKIAKFLNLGYPGGPLIEKKAQKGEKAKIYFPRPLLKADSLNFSFSGLKTAVINFARSPEAKKVTLEDICRAFQEAVVEVLVEKSLKAMAEKKVKQLLLCGGVAANQALRAALKQAVESRGAKLYYPSISLCTDNAAMIACAGYYLLKKGKTAELKLDAYANLPL